MQILPLRLYFAILVIFSCIQIFPLLVSGQSSETERENLADKALSEVISLYDRMMKQNSFIYNGRIYHDNYNDIRGHPYFSEESWEISNLIFKGEPVDSLYLMYDIYNDQVLLKYFNETGRLAPIILNSSDIKVFYLYDHSFIFLKEDTVVNMTEGIYDELYSGSSINLFVKRKKEIIQTSKWNDLWEEFVENDLYFLKKDGSYHRIKNLKSILKVLKDHKKELKIYIRNNNLNYMENFEESSIKIITYFETLLKF